MKPQPPTSFHLAATTTPRTCAAPAGPAAPPPPRAGQPTREPAHCRTIHCYRGRPWPRSRMGALPPPAMAACLSFVERLKGGSIRFQL
jgi:hypothetical protein